MITSHRITWTIYGAMTIWNAIRTSQRFMKVFCLWSIYLYMLDGLDIGHGTRFKWNSQICHSGVQCAWCACALFTHVECSNYYYYYLNSNPARNYGQSIWYVLFLRIIYYFICCSDVIFSNFVHLSYICPMLTVLFSKAEHNNAKN